MEIDKELKWLCENSRKIEKFSGNWIMFNVNEGVVEKSRSLNIILKHAKKNKGKKPYIFHVPAKEELNPHA